MAEGLDPGSTLRLDVWLWRARFFKTRSMATKVVAAGSIRIARPSGPVRVDKPATPVRVGDRLSFAAANGSVQTVEVVAFGDRRGPPAEAQTLYAVIAPATPPSAPEASPGRTGLVPAPGGRPTGKRRRAYDALRTKGAV